MDRCDTVCFAVTVVVGLVALALTIIFATVPASDLKGRVDVLEKRVLWLEQGREK